MSTDPLSVLVIEDDQATSRLIRYNLEDKNTQVIEAATGLDGIRILREGRIDLVLLDLRLPDFNGWGILSLLKSTERLHHTPVIVVSVEPPDAALVKQLKPDDYLQKPFDVRELITKVRKVMDMKSASRLPAGSELSEIPHRRSDMSRNRGREIISRTGYLLLALLTGVLLPLAIWVAVACGLYLVIREWRGKKAALTCSVDADCPPGYICVGGLCVPAT